MVSVVTSVSTAVVKVVRVDTVVGFEAVEVVTSVLTADTVDRK